MRMRAFLLPYQETPHDPSVVARVEDGSAGMNVHSTYSCYAVSMRIRQLQHSCYQLQYHIVWGTKYRRKILKHYVRKELIQSLYRTQRMYPDWYFAQINTGDDHVHILMEIPPKYALSDVVQKLKAYSSAHLRTRFPFINQIYEKRHSMWGAGYFVSSVGLNEAQIAKYIERQNTFDRGYDVTDELS